MLKQHAELLKHHFKIKRLGSKETDYEYRQRAFLALFQQHSFKATEILFGIPSWTVLTAEDRKFIDVAREKFQNKAQPGLRALLDELREDPAIRYERVEYKELEPVLF